jgi:hypothetical protein
MAKISRLRALLFVLALSAGCSQNQDLGDNPKGAADASTDLGVDGETGDSGIDGSHDGPVDGTVGDGATSDVTTDVSSSDGPTSDSGSHDGATGGGDAGDGGVVDGSSPLGPYVCPSCPAGTIACGAVCASTDDPKYGCGAADCKPCATGPDYSYVTMTCKSGACAVGSCPAGRDDCDGNPANGCEVDLNTSSTCGSCTNKCGSGQLCESGSCVTAATCPFPTTACNGGCYDESSNPEACSACGKACPTKGGTATCTSGSCGITCNAGYSPCANGCCATATACSPGYTACNGTCVNLRTDPHNCSVCGKVCVGTCAAGECIGNNPATVQIIKGLKGPSALALDDDNVYYIDNNTVWQASKTTLVPVQLGAANEDGPSQLAVANGNVYWTSHLGNAIRAVPIGGGTQQTLYTASSPTGITVDATDVYWSDDGTKQILKAAVAGGGTPTAFAAYTASPLLGDATNVYFSAFVTFGIESNSVAIAVDKSTGAQLMYQGGSFQGSVGWYTVAINSTTVFTFDSGGHFENVTSPNANYKTGSGGPPMYSPTWSLDVTAGASADTADDCSLFWTGSYTSKPTAGPTGIFSVLANQPSNEVTLLTTMVKTPGAIAVDAQNVYWVDATWIGRIAR